MAEEGGVAVGMGCRGLDGVLAVSSADRACTRREARGRIGLSRFARGVVVFASNARSGTIR